MHHHATFRSFGMHFLPTSTRMNVSAITTQDQDVGLRSRGHLHEGRDSGGSPCNGNLPRPSKSSGGARFGSVLIFSPCCSHRLKLRNGWILTNCVNSCYQGWYMKGWQRPTKQKPPDPPTQRPLQMLKWPFLLCLFFLFCWTNILPSQKKASTDSSTKIMKSAKGDVSWMRDSHP